jgi:hypothetical protein
VYPVRVVHRLPPGTILLCDPTRIVVGLRDKYRVENDTMHMEVRISLAVGAKFADPDNVAKAVAA